MLNGRKDRKPVAVIAVIIVSLFLFSGMYGMFSSAPSQPVAVSTANPQAYSDVSFMGQINNQSARYTGNMNVVLIFNFTNQGALSSLLSNLSNPFSPEYQHFLTASQFNAEFAPSASIYNSTVNYFSGYGITKFQKFSNRLILSVSGQASDVAAAFHTNITSPVSGGQAVYSPSSAPELPSWLSSSVSEVVGLTSVEPSFNLNIAKVTSVNQPLNTASANVSNPKSNYPSPIYTQNGIQYLYGSYFQPAYNEIPLLSNVTPTNAVIATILWSGSYTSNGKTVNTGPYDPTDISSYFAQSLPGSQPQPKIYAVPVNGALLPGTSAQNDTSGAVVENTLDLEMAGSTAPGASIYNVYGPNSTFVDLTTAFNTILSPNSSQPQALLNVSVISNSWGTNDTVSTVWNNMLQESQARGITVLASSGDSGDTFSSSKSVSNTEFVQFPSTVAYNTYGVVAVGGTNVTLNPSTFAITAQQAWYEPPTHPGGDTLGTVGGISNVYTEPQWQLDSQANTVLKGSGRGVPDIAAVANNTLIYFSNTTKSSLYIVSGTSVAAPIVAGLIAEMDSYRAHLDLGSLGFIDPSIYRLGTGQYDPSMAGGYSPSLAPFYDVLYGHNAQYSALPGYDLVTGMGSINAYNFLSDLAGTKYNVSFVQSGMSSTNSWSVIVEGTTYNSNGSYVNLSLTNGTYTFSVPNVGYNVSDPVAGNVTVHGSAVQVNIQFKRGYEVNFTENSLPQGTGWSVSAWNYTSATFLGYITLLFPNGSYDYSAMPSDPNFYGSTGNFTVNGSAVIVPVAFVRGIFNVTFVEDGLPAGHTWSVSNSTATLSSNNTTIRFTLPGGPYTFKIPPTGVYIANYTSITINTNGQNRTLFLNFSYGYFVTFNATGVPTGTPWTLLVADYNITSTNTSIQVEVQNGTYNYYAYYSDSSSTHNVQGNFTVNGQNQTIKLVFSTTRSLSEYYALYSALFLLGFAILIIGLVMLRKK